MLQKYCEESLKLVSMLRVGKDALRFRQNQLWFLISPFSSHDHFLMRQFQKQISNHPSEQSSKASCACIPSYSPIEKNKLCLPAEFNSYCSMENLHIKTTI